MKYETVITVDLPRDEFIKKLDNSENMKHWMRGLVSYEFLDNHPGEVGAKMKMHFKHKNRDMVMTETILKKDLPHEFHMQYEANGVLNIQQNIFREVDLKKTQWVSRSEFKFTSPMLKLMSFFMKGAFKKQSMQYAKDFKNFAEHGTSVANS